MHKFWTQEKDSCKYSLSFDKEYFQESFSALSFSLNNILDH